MRIAGIIAEYNPLHSGHIYQIKHVKEVIGADYVVAAISGSFTQRGLPAIFDKFTRTKLALMAGIDLVAELPLCVSTGSAGYFALGGVKTLKGLGVTDICFGSECGDIDKLKNIASLLYQESPDMASLVKDNLANGCSYPLAVSNALIKLYPEYTDILDKPNNMLAIEYINAARTLDYDVAFHTLTRLGAAYNETDYSKLQDKTFPSASMIRQAIASSESVDKVVSMLPDVYQTQMAKLCPNGRFNYLTEDDFTLPLSTILNSPYADNLLNIEGVTNDVLNRLKKAMAPSHKFSDYINILHTKNLPQAKAGRILSHILLGVTDSDYDLLKSEKASPYIRILGVRESSTALLKLIKESSDSTIICKVNKDSKGLPEAHKAMFTKDMNAYSLYRTVYTAKYPDNAGLLAADDSGLVIL